MTSVVCLHDVAGADVRDVFVWLRTARDDILTCSQFDLFDAS